MRAMAAVSSSLPVSPSCSSIRLPFSNTMLHAEQSVDSVDPALAELTPLQAMDVIVETAGALGLKIILDNHSREADGYIAEGLWYTSTVDEAAWIADWVMLAERFLGNDTVVAFDLNNEPHYGATWGPSRPKKEVETPPGNQKGGPGPLWGTILITFGYYFQCFSIIFITAFRLCRTMFASISNDKK